MLKVWAEYAKERFKAADTLIGEYRSWARQLVAAIGVVIGLEVTLLLRLALDGGSPLHASWRVLCLVVFFGMLGLQFWTLHRLLVVGYKSQPVVGPESPSVLANYVAERDEAEAVPPDGCLLRQGVRPLPRAERAARGEWCARDGDLSVDARRATPRRGARSRWRIVASRGS